MEEVGDGFRVVGPPGLIVSEVEVLERYYVTGCNRLQKLVTLLRTAHAAEPE